MEVFVNIFARATHKRLLTTIVEVDNNAEKPEREAARIVREKRPEIFKSPVKMSFEQLREIKYDTL